MKNECVCIVNSCPSILDQFQIDVPFDRKWKYVQFVTIYHILAHGWPMTNYEGFQALFQMLKVKNVSKKHCSDMSKQGMVEIMHIVLFEATKSTFLATTFIAISAREITTINNT